MHSSVWIVGCFGALAIIIGAGLIYGIENVLEDKQLLFLIMIWLTLVGIYFKIGEKEKCPI